jgi:hypothetical protein
MMMCEDDFDFDLEKSDRFTPEAVVFIDFKLTIIGIEEIKN